MWVILDLIIWCLFSKFSMGISRSNRILYWVSSNPTSITPNLIRTLMAHSRPTIRGASFPHSERCVRKLTTRQRALLQHHNRNIRLQILHLRHRMPNHSHSLFNNSFKPGLVHWPLGRLHQPPNFRVLLHGNRHNSQTQFIHHH